MGKGKKTTPNKVEDAEALVVLIEGFDYRVEPDDFLFFELDRLIEEDRASFEDEDFRRIINEGIRQHVEERSDIRADVSWRLRSSFSDMAPGVQAIARQVIAALEDIEAPLRHVAVIVLTYTAYLFRQLQEASDEPAAQEHEARAWIERWQQGEVLRQELAKPLEAIGSPAAGPLADLLFDSLDDRTAAETAIDILGGIRSSVSARVLAHLISEPMVDEELESRACNLLRALWPLPRHYILSGLSAHTHEDLPFRWFQLLIDSDEIYAVDLILEELVVHGATPSFHEDLLSVAVLLHGSKDPEIEDKVLQLLNSPETPPGAAAILQDFLREYKPKAAPEGNPWGRLAHLRAINQKYLAAAKLFDGSRKADALHKLDEVLREEPGYPFAVLLKQLREES